LEEYKIEDEDEILRHLNETTTSKAIASLRLKEMEFGESASKRKRKLYRKEENKEQ